MHLTFLILASCMTLVIYKLCGFLACHRVFHISTVRYMSMKSKGLLGLIPNVGDQSTQVLFQGPIHSWQIKCDIWLVWQLLLKSVLWWCLILDIISCYMQCSILRDYIETILTPVSSIRRQSPNLKTCVQYLTLVSKLYNSVQNRILDCKVGSEEKKGTCVE